MVGLCFPLPVDIQKAERRTSGTCLGYIWSSIDLRSSTVLISVFDLDLDTVFYGKN